MKINIPTLLTGGLVGITTCTGLVLTSVTTFADNDSATDDVNITVPVACSMAGHTDTAHNASLIPGTYSGASDSEYEQGIGKTTLTTFCNDNNGFSIYAIGFTGETEGNNTLVGTSASGGATIPTKVYESTDTTSSWSMKVTKVTDSSTTFNPANMTITNSFDSWHTVPDDYTKVAEYHASTGSSATDQSLGAKVETTYASYISTTQPADTYTGQVKYVMVHPYDATAPTPPSSNTSFEDAYAAAGKQKLNNYYQMKDMTGEICNAVTFQDNASETTLIDSRDNKTYTVSKFADGNCWMTQNLDHDIVATANYYTNENTDIGWNTSTNSYDTTSWTAEYATHSSADTYWCDEKDTNDNCSSFTIASYDPGNLYWNGVIGDYDEDQISSTGNPHYHLGNYYNWNAAVASNDSSSMAEGTLVDRSICPAGWTLPRPGTGSTSFYNLLDNYGFTTSPTLGNQNIWDEPLYFGLSGYRSSVATISSSMYDVMHIGYAGVYWTSLYFDGYTPTLAVFNTTSVLPADWNSVDSGTTSVGNSIRCIARPVSNTIEGL